MRIIRKTLKICGWVFLALVLLFMAGWASLVIYYSNLPGSLRLIAAIAYGLISILVFLIIRPQRRAVLVFVVFFAIVLIWWFTIPPRNDRDWQPDVAVLPYATINGNMITIHNIRNCDYRTETDYTVRHYDKTFGRNEDVYLYRLKANPEIIRKVFLDYLREVNRLKDAPEWYNALTDNCTTALRGHTAPYNPHAKLDWRIIVNGFGDQFIYEEKILDQSLPFEKLKSASQINARGKAADKGPDFSQRIREGLPGI